MGTELTYTAPDLERACEWLRAGKIVGIPTDTVYGLACLASDTEAVTEISRLKGRALSTPMALLVGDVAMGRSLMAGPCPRFEALAAAHWPGPLTLIVARNASVSETIAGGGPGVGIRVPDHNVVLALIKMLGAPIAATSANDTGAPPMTRAQEVLSHFGDHIAGVINAGPSPLGEASTVCSLLETPPRVLRVGGVKLSF